MFLAQHPFLSSTSGPMPPPAKPPSYVFSCSGRVESGGSIRLSLAGELDLAASDHFRLVLDGAQEDSTRVLLDLRALTLIDCAGLSIVFAAAGRSRGEEAVLILFDPRGQVRRLLDLIGVPAGVTVLDGDDVPHTGARVEA